MKEKIEKLMSKYGVKKLFLAAVILSLVLFCVDRVFRDFVVLGNTVEPRRGHTATLLQDGRVLITGGYSSYKTEDDWITYIGNASAEIFDPKTRKFTKTGDMTVPRIAHAAVLLQDGRVLVSGNDSNDKSVEIYDPKTELFAKVNDLNQATAVYSMILLNDGKVFVFSSDPIYNNGKVPQLFNPKTNSFSNTHTTNTYPIEAVLMDDGNIFLSCDTTYPERDKFCVNQIFNPYTATYTLTGKSQYAHSGGVVLKLANGDIGVFGGDMCATGNDCGVEIYSPSTGEFRTGAHFPGNKSISSQSAILLDDGKVLLVGGSEFIGDYGSNGYARSIKDAYLYDPIEDKFTKISDMCYKRGFKPVLTKLKDGNVLITGGSVGKRISDKPMKPELYIYKKGGK